MALCQDKKCIKKSSCIDCGSVTACYAPQTYTCPCASQPTAYTTPCDNQIPVVTNCSSKPNETPSTPAAPTNPEEVSSHSSSLPSNVTVGEGGKDEGNTNSKQTFWQWLLSLLGFGGKKTDGPEIRQSVHNVTANEEPEPVSEKKQEETPRQTVRIENRQSEKPPADDKRGRQSIGEDGKSEINIVENETPPRSVRNPTRHPHKHRSVSADPKNRNKYLGKPLEPLPLIKRRSASPQQTPSKKRAQSETPKRKSRPSRSPSVGRSQSRSPGRKSRHSRSPAARKSRKSQSPKGKSGHQETPKKKAVISETPPKKQQPQDTLRSEAPERGAEEPARSPLQAQKRPPISPVSSSAKYLVEYTPKTTAGGGTASPTRAKKPGQKKKQSPYCVETFRKFQRTMSCPSPCAMCPYPCPTCPFKVSCEQSITSLMRKRCPEPKANTKQRSVSCTTPRSINECAALFKQDMKKKRKENKCPTSCCAQKPADPCCPNPPPCCCCTPACPDPPGCCTTPAFPSTGRTFASNKPIKPISTGGTGKGCGMCPITCMKPCCVPVVDFGSSPGKQRCSSASPNSCPKTHTYSKPQSTTPRLSLPPRSLSPFGNPSSVSSYARSKDNDAYCKFLMAKYNVAVPDYPPLCPLSYSTCTGFTPSTPSNVEFKRRDCTSCGAGTKGINSTQNHTQAKSTQSPKKGDKEAVQYNTSPSKSEPHSAFRLPKRTPVECIREYGPRSPVREFSWKMGLPKTKPKSPIAESKTKVETKVTDNLPETKTSPTKSPKKKKKAPEKVQTADAGDAPVGNQSENKTSEKESYEHSKPKPSPSPSFKRAAQTQRPRHKQNSPVRKISYPVKDYNDLGAAGANISDRHTTDNSSFYRNFLGMSPKSHTNRHVINVLEVEFSDSRKAAKQSPQFSPLSRRSSNTLTTSPVRKSSLSPVRDSKRSTVPRRISASPSSPRSPLKCSPLTVQRIQSPRYSRILQDYGHGSSSQPDCSPSKRYLQSPSKKSRKSVSPPTKPLIESPRMSPKYAKVPALSIEKSPRNTVNTIINSTRHDSRKPSPFRGEAKADGQSVKRRSSRSTSAESPLIVYGMNQVGEGVQKYDTEQSEHLERSRSITSTPTVMSHASFSNDVSSSLPPPSVPAEEKDIKTDIPDTPVKKINEAYESRDCIGVCSTTPEDTSCTEKSTVLDSPIIPSMPLKQTVPFACVRSSHGSSVDPMNFGQIGESGVDPVGYIFTEHDACSCLPGESDVDVMPTFDRSDISRNCTQNAVDGRFSILQALEELKSMYLVENEGSDSHEYGSQGCENVVTASVMSESNCHEYKAAESCENNSNNVDKNEEGTDADPNPEDTESEVTEKSTEDDETRQNMKVIVGTNHDSGSFSLDNIEQGVGSCVDSGIITTLESNVDSGHQGVQTVAGEMSTTKEGQSDPEHNSETNPNKPSALEQLLKTSGVRWQKMERGTEADIILLRLAKAAHKAVHDDKTAPEEGMENADGEINPEQSLKGGNADDNNEQNPYLGDQVLKSEEEANPSNVLAEMTKF